MSVRKLKPITPGQRFRIVNEYSEVTTSQHEKSLLKPMKKSGGRNNQGRMTMRYKGGGHKKRYRVIDFKRDKYDVVGEVTSIEYDPNRSAFIALVIYSDNEKRYVIAHQLNSTPIYNKLLEAPGSTSSTSGITITFDNATSSGGTTGNSVACKITTDANWNTTNVNWTVQVGYMFSGTLSVS